MNRNKKVDYIFFEVIMNSEKLKKSKNSYLVEGKMYEGNLYEWGKEVMWWGRKLGVCKAKITNLDNINFNTNKIANNYITRDL